MKDEGLVYTLLMQLDLIMSIVTMFHMFLHQSWHGRAVVLPLFCVFISVFVQATPRKRISGVFPSPKRENYGNYERCSSEC